jgi:hypothetical protein
VIQNSDLSPAKESIQLGITKDIAVFNDLIIEAGSGLVGRAIAIVVGYSLNASPLEIYFHSELISITINGSQ